MVRDFGAAGGHSEIRIVLNRQQELLERVRCPELELVLRTPGGGADGTVGLSPD